jgi:hypothetical protein
MEEKKRKSFKEFACVAGGGWRMSFVSGDKKLTLMLRSQVAQIRGMKLTDHNQTTKTKTNNQQQRTTETFVSVKKTRKGKVQRIQRSLKSEGETSELIV